MAAERAETLVLGPQPPSPTRKEPSVVDDVPPRTPPLSEKKDYEYKISEEREYDENVGPLHFHAMRSGSARLKSAKPGPTTGTGTHSSSRSLSRSRSASPAPATVSTSISGVEMDDSCASLQSLSMDGSNPPIPPDILTDRMGMEELEPTGVQFHTSSLPLVYERMSEESLDDCHAFSDVTPSGRKSGSRANSSEVSLAGDNPSCNNSVLGMLKEEDDDDSDLSEDEDEPRKNERKALVQKVIFELGKVEESAGKEGAEDLLTEK